MKLKTVRQRGPNNTSPTSDILRKSRPEKMMSDIKELLDEHAMISDAIYQLKNQIIDEQIKEAEYECSLWLNTDFKTLKLSNKELREAYVKSKMGGYISKVGKLKNDLEYSRNQLKLCEMKINIFKESGIDGKEKE